MNSFLAALRNIIRLCSQIDRSVRDLSPAKLLAFLCHFSFFFFFLKSIHTKGIAIHEERAIQFAVDDVTF